MFAAADNEDRSGHATQQTAHQFYAAYVFMDVCRQWGELASDLEQKIKYAMWKAADINKAIKEGRPPKPGGVDEDGGFGLDDGMKSEPVGEGGGGGGMKAEGGGGGDRGFAGGFVPGGGDGGSESEEEQKLSQSFQHFSIKHEPKQEPMDMDEEKAPQLPIYPPPASSSPTSASFSSLPTSYLPNNQSTASYSDMPPPVPPQPPLSPNTANSLGFSPSTQPFSPSGLSPGYSPGFLGPAPSNSSSSASSSSASPPPSSARPNLPAPPARRPGNAGPPSGSDFPASSSSRYSPALPSQITPSALPAVTGKSRSVAVKEAERLMKHAGSALSFDDLDTAIVKMQQAVALLYNHRTPQ